MISKFRLSDIFVLLFSIVATTNVSAQLGGVDGGLPADGGLPQKNEWTLVVDVKFKGRATGFQRRSLLVQRRRGLVYVNGNKIEKLSDHPVVECVCKKNGFTSISQLKRHLSTQQNSQVWMPFTTMQYMGANGHEEVPLIMLSREDRDDLSVPYDIWLRRETSTQNLIYGQASANEQMRTAIVLQQQNIQPDMNQAAWAQAYHAKRQADAAED